MTLVNQPTKAPTRKMMAVMIAGIVTLVAQTALQTYFPDMKVAEFLKQLELIIQAIVMTGAGYVVKERG